MKIMKYTLWATVGLSLLFASCESILDINPKDRLTTKDYFTNEEQLQLYSNQFYSNNFPGDGDIYRDDADMLIVSPLSDEVSGQRVIPETGGYISKTFHLFKIEISTEEACQGFIFVAHFLVFTVSQIIQ